MRKIKFKRLHKSAMLPVKAHAGDAAFDLYALEEVVLGPADRGLVPTGIAIQLPSPTRRWIWEAQIRSRSGLRLLHGLVIPIATIDSGYRGDLGCVIFNHSLHPYRISAGERIGQLVITKLPRVTLEEAEELSDSERGSKGFGSSGRK